MREAEAPYKSELPYTYDPELDSDISEGRLLMSVILYAHMDMRGYARLTIKDMFAYIGAKYNATHWKGATNTRVLDAGFKWLAGRGYIRVSKGGIGSLLECTSNKMIEIELAPEMLRMDLGGGKDFEPYFQLYQNDVEKIFGAHDSSVRKLFRVYCYVKSVMPNHAPYAWCVTVQEIVDHTGYTPVYISKALHILCEELGVLHRAQLNRTSEMNPPYVYIADVTGWQKYLQMKVDDANGTRGGVPPKPRAQPQTADNPPEKDYYEAIFQPITSTSQLRDVGSYIEDKKLLGDIDSAVAMDSNMDVLRNKNERAAEIGLPDDVPLDMTNMTYLKSVVLARRVLGGEQG